MYIFKQSSNAQSRKGDDVVKQNTDDERKRGCAVHKDITRYKSTCKLKKGIDECGQQACLRAVAKACEHDGKHTHKCDFTAHGHLPEFYETEHDRHGKQHRTLGGNTQVFTFFHMVFPFISEKEEKKTACADTQTENVFLRRHYPNRYKGFEEKLHLSF